MLSSMFLVKCLDLQNDVEIDRSEQTDNDKVALLYQRDSYEYRYYFISKILRMDNRVCQSKWFVSKTDIS